MSWTGRCTVTLILIAFSIPSCHCILHTLLGVVLLYDSCILQGHPEAARELWQSQEATYLDIVFSVSPHRADMFLGTLTQTPEDCEKL